MSAQIISKDNFDFNLIPVPHLIELKSIQKQKGFDWYFTIANATKTWAFRTYRRRVLKSAGRQEKSHPRVLLFLYT